MKFFKEIEPSDQDIQSAIKCDIRGNTGDICPRIGDCGNCFEAENFLLGYATERRGCQIIRSKKDSSVIQLRDSTGILIQLCNGELIRRI